MPHQHGKKHQAFAMLSGLKAEEQFTMKLLSLYLLIGMSNPSDFSSSMQTRFKCTRLILSEKSKYI